jgi:hypothetical protein
MVHEMKVVPKPCGTITEIGKTAASDTQVLYIYVFMVDISTTVIR